MTTDLHTQLRLARGAHQQAEYALATLLFELHRTRRYTERGHASVIAYAEAELDLTPRQTRDLVFVAKRLAALPTLAAAFRAGRVAYTKAREVARVATSETDAAWTTRALETTNRALERQVAAARSGDAPPADPRAEPGPARVRVTVTLSAADAEVLTAAFARLRLDGGFGTDVENGTLLAEMARRTLAVLEAAAADPENGAGAPTAERFRVTLHHCPDCEKTHVCDPTAPNRADATDLACAGCDAEHLDLTQSDPAPRLKHAIPPATRRRVFEQFGHRCAVPHCRNRLWLDLHHIRPRAAGGDHRPGNLVCLCSVHHQMIHRGELFLCVEDARPGAPRLRFVLPTGETLGDRGPGTPPVADVVERLRHDLETAPGASGRTLTRGGGSGNTGADGDDQGLLAVALDTLHALGHAVSRPDDTWYGAERVAATSGWSHGTDAGPA
ncbi:HNH endonuclease [Myxococcota bacterium]|nr:HNH endonuclease [Myxococcota bacterium]